MFNDRDDAARQPAQRLEKYRSQSPLVLAIPRGAVAMAKIIAVELNGDFDVVLVRKLRAPYQPELAIGSIDKGGCAYITPHADSTGASAEYIESEKQTQMETIRKRRNQYTPV